MKFNHVYRKSAICLFVAMIPASVWASTGTQGSSERRKPPQEAFDVCKDKSEGAAVVITTPQGGTIKATCKSFDGQLAAVPEGPPPTPRDGGRGGPGN